MHLHSGLFKRIQQGLKTSEVRLFDEKRKAVRVGDQIIFKNRETAEELTVIVDEIITAESISQLQESIEVDSDVFDFYNDDDVAKFGVVGMHFRVV